VTNRDDQVPYSLESIRREFPEGDEIFPQIIRIFLDEISGKMDRLAEANRTVDIAGIGKIAHSLANSTGAVRAYAALELSRALERKARLGESAAIGPIIAQLSREIAEVITVLEQYQAGEDK